MQNSLTPIVRRADLVLAHAFLKAVAGVEAEAVAAAHSAGTALPLQRRRPAHPVLHQKAHPPACVIPSLLHRKHQTLCTAHPQSSLTFRLVMAQLL